ncbi:MAG: hypothetical protein Q8R57_11115 [Bacteroidota bacterium]|nr:hypothetical protein [Bacteroidota bacterium]
MKSNQIKSNQIIRWFVFYALLLTFEVIKAQPPGWPEYPPTGFNYNLDDFELSSPGTSWSTENNTDCEIRFNAWFAVNIFDEENGNSISNYAFNYILLPNSNGTISTADLYTLFFGPNWSTNGKTYTIIGTGVNISVAGSPFTGIIPPGCWTKVNLTGNDDPCKCIYYCFDFSDSFNPKLIINPVVAPDTCP